MLNEMFNLEKKYVLDHLNLISLYIFQKTSFHFHKHYLEKPRVDRILNIDINSIDNSAAKDIFYRSLSFPLQGICR